MIGIGIPIIVIIYNNISSIQAILCVMCVEYISGLYEERNSYFKRTFQSSEIVYDNVIVITAEPYTYQKKKKNNKTHFINLSVKRNQAIYRRTCYTSSRY